MAELQRFLLQRVDHPDPDYQELCSDLIHKTSNCHVQHALEVIEGKLMELTGALWN
jgi:hypothetical protein